MADRPHPIRGLMKASRGPLLPQASPGHLASPAHATSSPMGLLQLLLLRHRTWETTASFLPRPARLQDAPRGHTNSPAAHGACAQSARRRWRGSPRRAGMTPPTRREPENRVTAQAGAHPQDWAQGPPRGGAGRERELVASHGGRGRGRTKCERNTGATARKPLAGVAALLTGCRRAGWVSLPVRSAAPLAHPLLPET